MASEYEFVGWLRTGGAQVGKDPNGEDCIFDSPACRAILVRYRRMLRARLDLIAQNIANKDTTLDAQGANNPYRRQFVVADASGTYKIVEDPAPFALCFDPGNRSADSKGYVHYPNVDLSVEEVNALETTQAYNLMT